MNKNEALNILKNKPVFWSRLGFAYDPPLKNEDGKPLVFTEDLSKYGKYHRQFNELGVKIHTCILHLGWMGIDEYDYSLTDRVLDEVFKDNPDIYFIPRIKVNVPIDWCMENPEDVFVYYGGPDTVEGVKSLVGTLKQDYIGYEAPNGYYMAGDYVDTRPNVNSVIARQSFTSKKWLKDAKVALEKLLDRLENSKYADRILGYHIAYGVSGECVLWGRASNHYGDYGIGYKKAFYEWGLKKYKTHEALAKAWCQPEISAENIVLPSPEERYDVTDTVEVFFRKEDKQTICTDLDIFISEVNADVIEYFGKIVKEKTNGKLTGAFYGYFIHIDNPAYTGHLAIDRLLDSPYIDFFAAPKSYYRNQAGDPGGVLSTTQSINLKKLWLDELDNRTHLAKGVDAEWTSDNFGTTRTVFWREFAKNLADDSGFWWMDLGGGWFDSEDIMEEFSSLVKANDIIRTKKHESKSDILMLVDDECIMQMNISSDMRFAFMEDFLCELHMTGCLTDLYRLSDLEKLNLDKYKLIIFGYTFKLGEKEKEIIKNISPEKVVMFNYSAGVISDNGVSLENTSKVTGVEVEDIGKEKYNFPEIIIKDSNKITSLVKDEKGRIRVGVVDKKVVNTKPFMSREELRKITDMAGCHTYASSGNTVYGDNRFIGVFPSKDIDEEIFFTEKGDYVNLITGEEFKNTDKVHLKLPAKSTAFLLKK